MYKVCLPSCRVPHKAVLLIFLLWALLIYSNTLNASFHFDDEHVFAGLSLEEIFNKCTLRGGGNRVIAELTFAFNYWLSGTHVLGYHLFNILVHIGTAYLIYVFLSLVLHQCNEQGPCPSFEDRPHENHGTAAHRDIPGTRHPMLWPALLGSALFLVHPLATQAVTYITQRYTSLAAFFYMGTLASFVRARVIFKQNDRFFAAPHLVWYAVSFFLAVFAMLTKEVSITLPVAILMTEYYFIKTDVTVQGLRETAECRHPAISTEDTGTPYKGIGGRKEAVSLSPNGERLQTGFGALQKRILYLFPLLTTVLIIPAVRTLSGKAPGPKSLDALDTLTTWAPTVSRSSYFFTQLKVIVGTYLKLMVWPIGQNVDHAFVVSESLFETPVLASFLFLGTLFGVGLWLFRRSRLASFGIMWFLLTISPTSSIVPNTEFVAEHRAYIPLIGMSFVVAALPKWEHRWKRYICALIPVLLLASGLTYWRNRVWQTPLTLWADASQKSPERSRPLINYGRALREVGRLDEAVAAYKRALAVPPEPWREGKDHYIAYNNLGNVYVDQKRYQEALESFHQAAQIRPDSPTVLYNLGKTYEKMGAWEEAVKAYKKILSTQHSFPHLLFPDILFKLSEIYYAHGQLARSEDCLQQAIRMKPDFAEAYLNLADIHLARGEHGQAVRLYDRVVSLRPGFAEAYYNKGNALVGLNRLDEAEKNYRKAIRLKPGVSSFYNNLGNILMMKKAYNKAKEAYQTALSYNSNFAPAHLNLGIIYSHHLKDNRLAVFHLNRFLQLSPDDARRSEVEALLHENRRLMNHIQDHDLSS